MNINKDDLSCFGKPSCLSSNSQSRFTPIAGDHILIHHRSHGYLKAQINALSNESANITVQMPSSDETLEIARDRIGAILLQP